MAKEVSKTVIGAFVISAIALVVIGVVVFGSGKFFETTQKYVLFFEGSVKGLDEGSPVVWRGVKIGSVEEIVLLADPETLAVQIPVIIEVEPDRFQMKGERRKERDPKKNIAKLIDFGLRAKLAMQSVVTGQLMIDMDLRPESPAQLVGSDFPYPEIPTVQSTLAEIADTIQELPIKQMFNKLEVAIDNVSEALGDPALRDIVGSAKDAVQSADRLIKDADRLVIKVDKKVGPLADSFTTAAEDAQRLLQNLDRRVEPVTVKIEKTFDAAEAALMEAKKTLQGIEEFTAEDSALRYRVNTALEELAGAARSVRILSDYLEQYPDALLRGKGGPGGK